MALPFVRPVHRAVPRRPFDAEDPRALDLLKPWDDKARFDAALLGVPFDEAVIGRRGARFGPAAILEAFRYNSTYSPPLGLDLWRRVRVADAGELEVAMDVRETHDRLAQAVEAIVRTRAVPVVLGGDNSLSFATAKGLAARRKRVGLVVLDAHADLRPVRDGVITSGTSYRRVIDELKVPGKRVVEIGLKGFVNSRAHMEWGRRKGITFVTADEARQRGVARVVEEALARLAKECEGVFLSLDVDVLDQADAPGVSAPSPGGLRAPDLFEAMRIAGAHPKVHAVDLVEVAPPLDPTGNTARIAATALLHLFAGIARRK